MNSIQVFISSVQSEGYLKSHDIFVQFIDSDKDTKVCHSTHQHTFIAN